jgi:putative nucleotidyltransferase with HDIG domain
MERIIASVGELPTPPTVVAAVMGLTANLNTEVARLTRTLLTDQALTAKVLRLSNSPFYGRSRSISSLDEAIMILGFDTIRSLVVATSTYTMFKRGESGDLEDALWHHSLAVATGAHIVARRIGKGHSEEIFLAGLLHDIGILVLLKRMPEDFRAILDAEATAAIPRIELERVRLGFTHADLGTLVLEQWNFPKVLSDAVRCHHDPDSAAKLPDLDDSSTMIAHVVQFCDELANSLGYGFKGGPGMELSRLRSVNYLGLTGDAITQISEELTQRLAEEEKLFQ